MGLEIQISAKEKEDYFLVFDCTGSYSSTNKGGYGGANTGTSGILDSKLFIQGPSDNDYHEIDATGTIPNKDNIGLAVYPGMIGQPDGELESGKYKMKLEHEVQDRDGSISTKVGVCTEVFVNNIICCIDKHSNSVNENLFNDPRQKKTVELSLLLDGVMKQVDAGLYDKANETIDYMKLQCKCSEC